MHCEWGMTEADVKTVWKRASPGPDTLIQAGGGGGNVNLSGKLKGEGPAQPSRADLSSSAPLAGELEMQDDVMGEFKTPQFILRKGLDQETFLTVS